MRTSSSLAIAALLPLLCAAAPLSALASDKPSSAPSAPSASSSASSPPAPETADSLYNQGNEAYDKGDYALALALYTSAFKLRTSYDIARNLGLTQLKLGRYRDAIGNFNYSLEHYPSNRADTKKQVVEWLAQARTQVGTLHLVVDPSAADCKLNGAPIGADEREGDIAADPGEAKIECSMQGYASGKGSVKIEKGQTSELQIKLKALPDAKRGGGGGGGGDTIAPDPRRGTILWVGAAAAAAGIGVGAVTGVISLVKAGDADATLAGLQQSSKRASPCAPPAADAKCSDLLAARKEQDAFGSVAVWTLVAGGVAGAGTVAYALVTRSRPAAPAQKTSLAPVIAPGAAGVVISGAF
jgi:hypothetical protein